MTIITTIPWTRVNDRFIRSARINGTPVEHNVEHPLITSGPSSIDNQVFADFYQQVALDIVTETVFDYPYPYVSEKTLRPIRYNRMFIVVGPAHMLRTLHSKGFETFGDIINENYDCLEDPEERFLAIVDSVEQFCSLDIEEIKSYYTSNYFKFNHNRNRLAELHQEELDQLRSTL